MTNYADAPRLLAALGPQPLWLHYHCIPVWEDAETLYVVAWKALAPALLEDLSLIFGKVVLQKETGERDALIALIKAHAADQPISELPE